MDSAYLGLVFAFFHALGLLISGIFSKDKHEKNWASLMVISGSICLGLTTILWFVDAQVWPLGMAALGAASSLYMVGWSYPFTVWTGQTRQIPFMAGTMLWANIIFIGLSQFHKIIPLGTIYAFGTLPLVAALWMAINLRSIKNDPNKTYQGENNKNNSLPLPVMLILVLCLFIFGFNINGGLMYNVIHPFFSFITGISIFYWFLPYIAVLILMLKRWIRIKRPLMVYLSASLMGLSFVFFALLEDSKLGYFTTATLINGAFAFLDLFIWITLGTIACLYGQPFRVFGFGLAANVGAIFVGGLIGKYLLIPSDNVQVITALFAIMIIFITILIIPWLDKQLEKGFESKDKREKKFLNADDKNPTDMISYFPGYNLLTPREHEIANLLLGELTNSKIAESLFISDNTLKTHLKNIYRKLNVANKKELRAIAYRNQKTSTGQPKPSGTNDNSEFFLH